MGASSVSGREWVESSRPGGKLITLSTVGVAKKFQNFAKLEI